MDADNSPRSLRDIEDELHQASRAARAEYTRVLEESAARNHAALEAYMAANLAWVEVLAKVDASEEKDTA